MTLMAGPHIRAELEGPTALGETGVAELTLRNSGTAADVYRLTVETEFHQQATAQPSTVRLDPGTSRTVTVASHAPVAVRVYSQVSGQRVSEAYLGR